MKIQKSETIDKNLRIAVIGVGGVGGYLSGMLLRAFSNVTLVARGGRYEAIQKNGLVLHSEYSGESIGHPAALVQDASMLEEQDVILICVKNYSLDEILPALAKVSTENTILVPVMNGVDAAQRIRAAVKNGRIVESVIYTVSYAKEDYSIVQEGTFTSLRIGASGAACEDTGTDAAVQLISDMFTEAGIEHKISEDVRLDIWRKYILNCAFNVETAAYQLSIGGLRTDPKYAQEYVMLVREAAAVARAKGIPVTEDHEQMIIRRFDEYADDATSSLQRDIRDGKRAETDTFSGYLIREAEALGIDVPVSRKMSTLLEKLVS